jgi:hypothetical protein
MGKITSGSGVCSKCQEVCYGDLIDLLECHGHVCKVIGFSLFCIYGCHTNY